MVEKPVHHAYAEVALGKKAGEIAVRTLIPALVTRGLGLVAARGDMVDGTITAKLLTRIDPTMANKRLENPRRLPTTVEIRTRRCTRHL